MRRSSSPTFRARRRLHAELLDQRASLRTRRCHCVALALRSSAPASPAVELRARLRLLDEWGAEAAHRPAQERATGRRCYTRRSGARWCSRLPAVGCQSGRHLIDATERAASFARSPTSDIGGASESTCRSGPGGDTASFVGGQHCCRRCNRGLLAP